MLPVLVTENVHQATVSIQLQASSTGILLLPEQMWSPGTTLFLLQLASVCLSTLLAKKISLDSFLVLKKKEQQHYYRLVSVVSCSNTGRMFLSDGFCDFLSLVFFLRNNSDLCYNKHLFSLQILHRDDVASLD